MRIAASARGVIPAGLNFGDVFAYALARTRRLPLSFIANDSLRTDIVPASGRVQS